MERLEFLAEHVSEVGGITGGGLGKLLGAPDLSPLELLIRESVQNSWDARREDETSIHFNVEFKEIRNEELTAFRNHITSGLTPASPEPLKKLGTGSKQDVLIVSDRNTKGLGGTTRSDVHTEGTSDFVNFVFMIGETKPSTDHQGSASGGSYGYGRSSFFRASRAKTILVHSRALVEGQLESRFVGISWQDKYHNNETKVIYTGRHWWGVRDENQRFGPLVGDDADTLAMSLGMDVATNHESGTTVMILDPVLEPYLAEENDGDRAVPDVSPQDQIVSSIIWNCWPRIIDEAIKFSVRWNGESIEIPDIRRHPRLRVFVRAYDAIRKTESSSAMASSFDIKLKRPKRLLGQLGVAKRPFEKGGDTLAFSCPVGDDEPLRHVALMRNTRLILKYVPMKVAPVEGEQFAGVFLTDREVEGIFQRSEPPSHDDWVAAHLSTRVERSHINVAFDRIEKKTRQFITPSPTNIATTYHRSVAGLADQLAGALPGLDTTSRGKQARNSPLSSGGSSARKPKVTLGTPTRRVEDGRTLQEIPFNIKHLRLTSGSTLIFEARVVIAGGGKESKSVTSFEQPVFRRVVFGSEDVQQDSLNQPEVTLQVPADITEGLLLLEQPSDCFVELAIKTESFTDDETGEVA
ncbi:hypothetical protein FRC98_02500 [Lujinxingia vulgaris]|uniref:Uncharacterized protein n=1 Tax=Lujinxingia vulgaris TaxID=2600176 RepID=A0A5C6XPG7_9DELT|nr:hypothetical protein [Lujinxingia vulgaris]TXD39289.1 hypothetical protein FRC98_02500 [Lujinxingia vulgaris]